MGLKQIRSAIELGHQAYEDPNTRGAVRYNQGDWLPEDIHLWVPSAPLAAESPSGASPTTLSALAKPFAPAFCESAADAPPGTASKLSQGKPTKLTPAKLQGELPEDAKKAR